MHVALLTDREQRVEGDPDLTSRRALAHAAMEYYLARAMRQLRHRVTIVPCLSEKQLLADLTRVSPDVVFNATEHLHGDPTADVQIAILLESLRLPYTGGSPTTLLLCRDKAASKSVASAVGVRVPPGLAVPPGSRNGHNLPPFPLIVKPASRDSSVGVSVASYVRTQRALHERIALIHRHYRDTAVVESFVPGVDLNIFVIEQRRLKIAAPTIRRVRAAHPSSPHSMITYHVKHNDAYRTKWKTRSEPANLPARALRTLHEDIRRLWPVLQLRDYARFDFRMPESGELYFIEANANAGFSPASRSERWTWEEYRGAVKTVLGNAVRRGG
jgi:D-alanine-D-alanine ligase